MFNCIKLKIQDFNTLIKLDGYFLNITQ